MAKSDGKSVLYYGCVGCFVVVALVVVAAGGVAGLAWYRAQNQEIAEQTLERPVAPVTPPRDQEPSALSPPTAAGRVVLDLSGTEFRIRPGGPGEALGVRASYDMNSYAMEQEETVAEDGTWTWRVRFERTGGFLTAIQEMLGGTKPDVEFVLPTGVPLALDATMEQGALQGRLDGLWLTDVAFEGRMGAGVLDIGEPAPQPAESFTVKSSMGGWVFRGVANLSPRTVSFESSMGGGVLDLQGDWMRDASISVRNRRGGLEILVDDDEVVTGLDGVEGAGGAIAAPEDAERPEGPTLAFEVAGDLEDVRVRRQ